MRNASLTAFGKLSFYKEKIVGKNIYDKQKCLHIFGQFAEMIGFTMKTNIKYSSFL